MIIRNPKLTARQAADQFAATNWEHTRHVGVTDVRDDGKLRFNLVDGVKWYLVVPFGVIGWEIVDAD